MKKLLNQKWRLVGIITLVILCAVSTGCVANTVDNDPSAANTAAQGQQNEVADPVTTTAATTAAPAENIASAVGDTAKAKSYTLTVESLNVIESDNMFSQPQEGHEFIEIVIVLENISDNDISVSSLMNFDAYLDGYSTSESLMAQSVSEHPTVNGTMKGGKKLKGALCYEVPTDWEEIEIDVDIGFISSNEVSIVLKNQ